MKAGSDNFRESSVFEIISQIQASGIEVILYEPTVKKSSLLNMRVETNFDNFKGYTDLILANRMEPELNDVRSKIFTRDLYGKN